MTEVSYRNTFLTKCIPDQEDHTDADDESDDDGVASLSKIDLVDEIIDHREFAGEVVELGLDRLGKTIIQLKIFRTDGVHLQYFPLVDKIISGVQGDVDLFIN